MLQGYAKSFALQMLYLTLILLFFWVSLVLFCPEGEEHFNGITKEADQTFGDKLFNRFYFSLVTATTLGYGDISPKSKTARTIVMIFMFVMFFGFLGILTEMRIHYAIENLAMQHAKLI